MPNSSPAIVFPASGRIETYVVPATGGYIIEACGAAAGDGDDAVRGDRVKGMFYLNRGDVLKILVGTSHGDGGGFDRSAGASPGGSIVWRGAGEDFSPAKLMLAAGGGQRLPAGTGPSPAAENLPCSFNAGAFQLNCHGLHAGEGCVSVAPVTAPVACGSTEEFATFVGPIADISAAEARRDDHGDADLRVIALVHRVSSSERMRRMLRHDYRPAAAIPFPDEVSEPSPQAAG